jgi:ELWxxDGT repeat protein
MPVAIFAANDGVHGVELWRTDGTSGGTQLLKDIKPGGTGSQIAKVTKSGNYAYFTAVDDIGIGLWRTDGTEAGTIRLNLLSTTESDLRDVNGTLYFTNGPGNNVLWKSDGTAAGTTSVINTESNSINLIGATDLGVMFISSGVLWRSGGTVGTTLQLAPISGFNENPADGGTATIGGAMIFRARSQNNGIELWRSDGTPEGTAMLRDLLPGTASSGPRDFVQFNGAIYFIASGPGGSSALWRTDGTSAGTVAVRELAALRDIATDGTRLFIVAGDDAAFGRQLWVSDGTTAGTVFVRTLPSQIFNLTVSDGLAYFQSFVSVDTLNSFVELWRSDGTDAGTFVTRDIRPGAATSNPQNLTPFGGDLIFTADDDANGDELWLSDGTGAGTNLLANINLVPERGASLFVNTTEFVEYVSPGGQFQVLFSGRRPEDQTGLWRSDGQTGIELQRYPNEIFGLTTVGDKAFFFSNSGLWLTQGSGTPTLLKNFQVAPGTAVNFQGQLFFIARETGSNVSSLYRSDGTAAGTVVVKAGVASSFADFEIANGKLFFRATDPNGGHEVWVSDGTAAGTFLTRDIVVANTVNGDTLPSELTALNGIVYFAAYSALFGQGSDRELWRTDGTFAGTVRVEDIRPGTASADPKELTVLGGTLYFTANDGVNGRELWKSDGTEAGTFMVRNIRPDVTDTGPTGLVATVNGKLFFFANDGAGERLWVSDGTAAGTVQVPGLGVGVQNLTRVGGLALFTYDDGISGRELWVSDGTGAGTRMLVELAPGAALGIQVDGFTVENFTYFELFNAATGWELWRTDGTAAGTVPITDTSNPGASNAYGFAVLGTFNDIVGTSGNDQLQGTAGVDRLFGLAGDDLLSGGFAGDTLDGGLGSDTASYFGEFGGVWIDLATGVGRWNSAEGDTLVSIENVVGTDFTDWLTGNASDNRLEGGLGADRLLGGLGADQLIGGGGNDVLAGNFGADLLDGGADVDMADYAGEFGGVWIDLGAGFGRWNSAEGDTLASIENVIGTDFTDWLTGDGANNRLDGGSGDDRLLGAAGNDVLIGGFGADLLDGGADVDTADYSGLFGGVWINLATGVGKWNSAEGDTLTGIDKLIGTDFTDWFESSTRTDFLTGGAANDLFIFQAGFGQDVITDFQGNGAAAGDTIRFGAGTFANFAAVQAAMSQQGSDVLITLNAGNILTLQNTTIAQLNAQDFLFG